MASDRADKQDYVGLRIKKEQCALRLLEKTYKDRAKVYTKADRVIEQHIQHAVQLSSALYRIPAALAKTLSEKRDAREIEDMLALVFRETLKGETPYA